MKATLLILSTLLSFSSIASDTFHFSEIKKDQLIFESNKQESIVVNCRMYGAFALGSIINNQVMVKVSKGDQVLIPSKATVGNCNELYTDLIHSSINAPEKLQESIEELLK